MAIKGVSPNSRLPKKERMALPAPATRQEEIPQHQSVHGPVSAHPGSNQPNLNEGQFGPSPHHETTFWDLPQEHRNQIREHAQKAYGLSYEGMVHNMGQGIDTSMTRAQQAQSPQERAGGARAEGAGQRWYAGGPGTAQQEVQEESRRSGLPPHVVGYQRASVSHNMSAENETGRVRAVNMAMEKNPDIGQFQGGEGGTPTGGMHWNARNAARIREGHLAGIHPADLPGEGQPHHGMEEGPARKSAVTGSDKAVKPLSYGQAYAHPNVHGRPTADRWTYRGALGPGGTEKAARKMQEHIAPKSLVPDPKNPEHQIHGLSLMTSAALSEASRKRGLAPHEGQTLQWNEDRDVAEKRSAPIPKHIPENVNQGQFKLGLGT
jgi:hypothetical protein